MSRFANVVLGDRSGERFWWLSRRDFARGQTFGCFASAEPYWIEDRRAQLARRGLGYPEGDVPRPGPKWARTRRARRRYLAAVAYHRARRAHLEAQDAHRVGLDQRGELEATRRGLSRAAAEIGMERRGRDESNAERRRRLLNRQALRDRAARRRGVERLMIRTGRSSASPTLRSPRRERPTKRPEFYC